MYHDLNLLRKVYVSNRNKEVKSRGQGSGSGGSSGLFPEGQGEQGLPPACLHSQTGELKSGFARSSIMVFSVGV